MNDDHLRFVDEFQQASLEQEAILASIDDDFDEDFGHDEVKELDHDW